MRTCMTSGFKTVHSVQSSTSRNAQLDNTTRLSQRERHVSTCRCSAYRMTLHVCSVLPLTSRNSQTRGTCVVGAVRRSGRAMSQGIAEPSMARYRLGIPAVGRISSLPQFCPVARRTRMHFRPHFVTGECGRCDNLSF